MAQDQFVVVVYDISDNKRRTRLHKLLQDYGTAVQYSVFECLLTTAEVDKMKRAVARVIRPKKDHVRYYVLCGACQPRIEATGFREITAKPEVIVV